MWLPLLLLAATAATAFHVSVETWRWVPHSYGIVGQELALNLHRLVATGAFGNFLQLPALPPEVTSISITMFEAPVYNSAWKNRTELRPERLAAELAGIGVTPPDSCPDIVFRAYFPLNFAPWPLHLHGERARGCRPLILTFGTTEYQTGIPEMIANPAFDFHSLAGLANVYLVPPSEWAMQGFEHSGVPRTKMWLLPHGYDRDVYRCGVNACLCGCLCVCACSWVCI